ncbi:MAG: transcription-repair coupling factor [Endomicrobium sp.]|nr:transcription-repair coupling factor [Endomicrobium sp.]
MRKKYLSGVVGSGKAHYLFRRISEIQDAGEISDLHVFTFVKEEELNSFYDDICSFFDSSKQHNSVNHTAVVDSNIETFIFPSDDVQQRAFTTDKIKNLRNFIVCATDISINSPVPIPQKDIGITISKYQKCDLNSLERYLISFGYTRASFVEDRLQFAVRGGIIDVWPAVSEFPVRILFEYNIIEALRVFNPDTQLSSAFIDEIKILSVNPAEYSATIKDYFEQNKKNESAVDESVDISHSKISIQNSHTVNTILYFDYPLDQTAEEIFNEYELIINDALNTKAQYQGYKSFTGFYGNINFFINSLKSFAENNITIKIYCANDGERERISDILYENRWCYESPEFLYGKLSQGFYLENTKTACISSREMLYKKRLISFPKISGGRRLEAVWEISTGNYVVHEKYGIGRYMGLKTISRENSVSEYLCIEYRNGDKLYVPPEELKTVKKYVGTEGVKPKLYSMDTLGWERVKSRARKAAAEFAKELLKLYTQRSLIKRKPFGTETIWEKELEDAFPYDETPDQLKAIEDIKNDFFKPYPMERLICGDVGYGKTEVAVRAAFKVVQEGMQVAVLVPTTVLAQQHYNTFYNRLSIFPTKIDVISRFQTKTKQREITQNLENGLIDIIVGTHRLFQKDVKFKILGLLIVDEEHRFGVKQKEKIKAIKKNIDILMLSATPIPRTLSSALSGFKDLSVIETPPFGRLPIETNLSLYDDKLVKNIIEAELSRNGQVFYVYNKVETILTKAESIKKLLPKIKLGVIHGQMKTKDIEDIMWKFVNIELDVLLATTIIESGLDIPSVNTMIIEEAQNFGLSQLYQLRGRIGRDREKAYCYLFYTDKVLSDEAVKRLKAMKEFSELGSGFKLALKDLEIRGAGGMLSADQHGFVRDIGYDMFAKLLEEEGKKIKEGPYETQEKKNTTIDLKVSALIPHTYIEDEDIRILFYRKLSDAQDVKAIEKITSELLDRFGKIPDATKMLFKITSLKITAEKLYIERISEDNYYIYLYFSKKADFSKVNITKLIDDYSNVIEFIPGQYYAFKLKKNIIDASSVEYLKQFLVRFGFYLLQAPV